MDNLAVRIWFRAVWLLLVVFWISMLITEYRMINNWLEVLAIGLFSIAIEVLFSAPMLLVLSFLIPLIKRCSKKKASAVFMAISTVLLGGLLFMLTSSLLTGNSMYPDSWDIPVLALCTCLLPGIVSILSFHKQFNISNTPSY